MSDLTIKKRHEIIEHVPVTRDTLGEYISQALADHPVRGYGVPHEPRYEAWKILGVYSKIVIGLLKEIGLEVQPIGGWK